MRVRGYVVALGLTGLALAPVLREPPRDSFPLSNYPMFSTRPDDPWVFVGLGVDAQGEEHSLTPWLLSGSYEVMQSAETVRIAVSESADAQASLCREIAGRVALDPSRTEIEQVRVVGLSFDPIRYFTDEGAEPVNRFDYASCPVERLGEPE